MEDIMTIVWKELKELWHARGGMRSRLLSYLPLLLVFGVILPLQEREAWVNSPLAGIFSIVLPFILAGGAVADSFAGERERHTLETLLATRLSDRDIFLGKVLACVIYSITIVWASMLLSLIALNVARGTSRPFFYPGAVLIMIVFGTILSSLFIATIGVFISLRAPTARAAAQVFSVATLVLFVGGPLLLQALPASAKDTLLQILSTANLNLVGIVVGLVTLALDIILLAIGIARFQRRRLILED
nr:ABC transporter permease [Chloroflexota bacterium]